jgi:hypothetical protein
MLDDGCDDDGMCHSCAHAIAEGSISAQCSARDLTIRDLRAALGQLVAAATDLRQYPTPKTYTSIDAALSVARRHLGSQGVRAC